MSEVEELIKELEALKRRAVALDYSRCTTDERFGVWKSIDSTIHRLESLTEKIEG